VWAGGAEREAAEPHPMNLMRTLPKYLTHDELKRFFAAIDAPRDRALFAVIYHYGLRVDEATHLGSALHVMLAKRFRATVDPKRFPRQRRSTASDGHQRSVSTVSVSQV
jgi:site-specific recombinase XerD